MNLAINIITGFTQGHEEMTGPEQWWATDARQFAGPRCTVYQPATWKMTVTRRLEQLQRLKVRHLFLVAYSHGQQAALQIAERARQFGIHTVDLALWDPVGRSAHLPRWTLAQLFTARSLTDWHNIPIPETVSSVVWARQHTDRPRGHELHWNPAKTDVRPAVIVPVGHTELQWHPAVHRMTTDAVTKWHNLYNP
jgi:hypothetical protein